MSVILKKVPSMERRQFQIGKVFLKLASNKERKKYRIKSETKIPFSMVVEKS